MPTWTSPSEGDSFGSGDTIVVKWNVADAVVSPSIRLCGATDGLEPDWSGSRYGNCGSAIWPTVTQTAGSYLMSIVAPGVDTYEAFYLEMRDDFGETSQSHCFSIHPAAVPSPNTENSPVQSTSPQLGLPDTSMGVSPPPLDPYETPLAIPSQPVPTSTPTLLASSSSVPYFSTVTRTPPPVAAFAIPLSLIGAILLVASGFSIRHNQHLKGERARHAPGLYLSSKSSLNSTSANRSRKEEDVVNMLSRAKSIDGPVPVPVFLPVDLRREPRRSTRQPFFTYPWSSHPSNDGTPGEDKLSLDPGEQSANATIMDSLLSNHLHPSPALPSAPLLSSPEVLHTRSEASMESPSYFYRDKPLPSCPRPREH